MCIARPKILCLFSAPLINEKGDPIDALDIEAERNAIVGELSALNREITLRIGFATVDELARGIKDGFNILHFSGHGSKEALVFENGKGGCQLVRGDYLKRLIGTGGPFDLAVISACHSEPTGSMILEAGVRHVVAIRRDTPILDLAAIAFAGTLYRHLLGEDSVQHAFDMAKLLVEGNPDLVHVKPVLELEACQKGEPFVPEEEKFLLLPIDNPSFHQKSLFKDIERGSLSIQEAKRAKSNLPVRPQSFTGRSKEISMIINMLLENRFVTVTGAGGIGKTTVAVEAVRWFHFRGHFKGGVFLLNLREPASPSRIIDLIGSCVEKQFPEVRDLIEYLQDCQTLLVLDNAEEMLLKYEKQTRDIINSILKFAPDVKLLLTSQRLVGGVLHEPERVCRLGVMSKYNSARLFAATSKRSISEEEWQSTEFRELLQLLGGHPLSIVLMARQLIPGMTIEQLIVRIRTQRAKAIVVKGITDRDPEHGESLVATLASSFDSLDSNSREIFIALSLLPAGAEDFTIRQIFGEESWESIQKLNDASLAEITEFGRVVLLPPVRLFAESLLTEEIMKRHGPKIVNVMASYAHQFLTDIGREGLRPGSLIFTLEEPNLRLALELPCTCDESKKEVSDLGTLSACLTELYHYYNRCKEAMELEHIIVSGLEKLRDDRGLAAALQSLGKLALRVGDPSGAKTKFETALKLYQEIGSKLGEAESLFLLGRLAMRKGDPSEAKTKLEAALKLYQEGGGKLGEANIIRSLGELAMRMGDSSEAKTKLEAALKLYQDAGGKLGEAYTLQSLGDLAMGLGDSREAKTKLETALELHQEIGSKLGEANCLSLLGDLAMQMDDSSEAKTRLEAALELHQEIGSKLGEANTLRLLGDLAMQMDDSSEAKTKLETALELHQEIGGGKLSEANTLFSLGELAMQMDDTSEAKTKLETALKLYQDAGGKLGEANCLSLLGDLAMQMDDPSEAKTRFETALKLYQEGGGKLGEANIIRSLGELAMQMDDTSEAKTKLETALKLYQEGGDKLSEANTLFSLGELAMQMDDPSEAKTRFEAALKLYQDAGGKLGEANCLSLLGDLAMQMDDPSEAKTKLETALELHQEIGSKLGEANTLFLLGRLAMQMDDSSEAKTKLETALKLYQEIGSKLGEARVLKLLNKLSS